ncbi:MAG TPA: D-lactate dehydrogenase [Devosia sp.]|nr:D-lactate dehydrogenase [Devosia sp.]
MTDQLPVRSDLLARLRTIVGDQHVLTGETGTRRFRKGFRGGDGKVLAVVRPGSLLEQWRTFKAVVEAGAIVIMQAANTGLTGGSSPAGDDYDRDIVIINTLRIGRIDLLRGGKQVLCLAGATLHQLERKIRPLGREPHSVIGSTTVGASVVGGVCNNSGGALIQRGPAFTQYALFARVEADGSVSLLNHLGIELGKDAEDILARLDRGVYTDDDVRDEAGKLASDPEYQHLIREVDSPLPARYNNDPRLLFEAAGSAGKLCVFAVRLDTFESAGPSRVFYVGSNDYLELTKLRRHILSRFEHLPVAGEYLHRDAYDLARRYGKDLYLFLKHFGTEWLAKANAAKSRFDALTARLGLGAEKSDHMLQAIVGILPDHLPKRMNAFRDAYEHHLLIRVSGEGVNEARGYLSSVLPSGSGSFFECNDEEALAAFRHRYAIGGAAVRFAAVSRDEVEGVIPFDMAFPRNTIDWRESTPAETEPHIAGRVRCGHFFCQVFHYDYLVRRGQKVPEIKEQLKRHLEHVGVEFPSEHNVGHLYKAKPALAQFYRELDPTNTLNPGIGQSSKRRNWG